MKFEELEIGKRYFVQRQIGKNKIGFVCEILNIKNKNTLFSEVVYKPIFWIYGYGGYNKRSVKLQFWHVWTKVKEVEWKSKEDCPEYFI